MALTKYLLGELLVRNTETNESLRYGTESVRGLLNTKGITNTKADMDGRDLTKFLVVRPGGFVFNHRVHDKLGLGYNTSDETYIFTNDYVAFYVKSEIKDTVLLPDYLYMWFLRSEFDRYMLFKTYGSATLFFNWDNMCELEITLPDITVQKEYVDIYKAMIANQQSYERGLEDLKLMLDAVVEKYKNIDCRMSLNEIANESDERNFKMEFTEVNGVNKEKAFMPSVASGEDLSKYKIVRKNQLACNLMHVGRDVAIPIALQTQETPIIVSPAYIVFDTNNEKVLPQYVLIWFSRIETDRNAWFMCDNNIRGGMEKKRFFEMSIPVPSIEEQQTLVELHEAMSLRRTINERMKALIKAICPILIKGSLEEGKFSG